MSNFLKGVCHEIFDLRFFMIRTHLGPWSIFKFSFDFAEIFNHKVRKIRHRRVKILGLANKNFVLQIFSFMIDLFTPKRISLDCPFKSNQRLTKILILTPRCDALRGAMLITEFFEKFGSLDSAMWCKPPSWQCGMMHTAKSDSAVCITPQSQTSSKMSVFCVFKERGTCLT